MRALNQNLVDIAQKHGFVPSFDIKWHPYQLNKHVNLSGIEYMTDSLDIAINTTSQPEIIKYSLTRIYTDGATDKTYCKKICSGTATICDLSGKVSAATIRSRIKSLVAIAKGYEAVVRNNAILSHHSS